VYAGNPDTANHIFGTAQGAGTAILTFLGGFHPQTESLWLTDMAHHHLAIAADLHCGWSYVPHQLGHRSQHQGHPQCTQTPQW
jgi:hypothetical protein